MPLKLSQRSFNVSENFLLPWLRTNPSLTRTLLKHPPGGYTLTKVADRRLRLTGVTRRLVPRLHVAGKLIFIMLGQVFSDPICSWILLCWSVLTGGVHVCLIGLLI